MADRYPHELKLPLAPYRFVWRDEPAVAAQKSATDLFTEERYTHADGSTTIIREYGADGSFHILSDRGRDRAHRQRPGSVRPRPGQRGAPAVTSAGTADGGRCGGRAAAAAVTAAAGPDGPW